MPDGPERVHLRTFATWKIQHDLGPQASGKDTPGATPTATPAPRSASPPTCSSWLSRAHPDPRKTSHQEHLDCWLAEGSTHRTRIRTFIPGRATAQHHRAGSPCPRSPPSSTSTRSIPASACSCSAAYSADESLDLRDRVAGCLLTALRPADQPPRAPDPKRRPRPPGRVLLSDRPRPAVAPRAARHAHPRSSSTQTNSTMADPRRPLRQPPQRGLHARDASPSSAIKPSPPEPPPSSKLARRLPAAILADLLGFADRPPRAGPRLANGDWTRYAAHRAETTTP